MQKKSINVITIILSIAFREILLVSTSRLTVPWLVNDSYYHGADNYPIAKKMASALLYLISIKKAYYILWFFQKKCGMFYSNFFVRSRIIT